MDIVSRLKKFLQDNNISNSQFADTCNIPRPTLSQLLNGRNKKVSDELIAKIHQTYPALNVMWLMFGDGEMFVPNANSSAMTSATQPGEISIDFGMSSNEPKNPTRQSTINFAADDTVNFDHNTRQAPAVPTPAPRLNIAGMQRTTAPVAPPAQRGNATSQTDRYVTHIVVYYSDGRYETFMPQVPR